MGTYITQLHKSKTKQEEGTKHHSINDKCYTSNAGNEGLRPFNPLAYSKGSVQNNPIQRVIDLEAVPNERDMQSLRNYIRRNRIGCILQSVRKLKCNGLVDYTAYETLDESIDKLKELRYLNMQEIIDVLNQIKTQVHAITEREDHEAEGMEADRRRRYEENTLEHSLNNILYKLPEGGALVVAEIHKQLDGMVIDGTERLTTTPSTKASRGKPMGQTTTNVYRYAEIKANAAGSLQALLTLAEDVTCWVKYGGRRIDARRLKDRIPQHQNDKSFGALRSVHQNAYKVLPEVDRNVKILGGGTWDIWSKDITTNSDVEEVRNPKRFLEYTINSWDRMVYDTKACIAYFSQHYQFLNDDYKDVGQNVDAMGATKSPWFGIDMSEY